MPEPMQLQPPPASVVDEMVLAALAEDGADDDLTTRALVRGDQWGQGCSWRRTTGSSAGWGWRRRR